MAILVLGDPNDDHAIHVKENLENLGHQVEILDSDTFPDPLRVFLDPISRDGMLTLPQGNRYSFSEIQSIYWRNYGEITNPSHSSIPDLEQRHIAINDSRSLLESVFFTLPAKWVNGWEGFQLHQRKPAALIKVAQLGIPVPATIFSNDPATITQFVNTHKDCIFKPVQGGAHTRPLSKTTLTSDKLDRLRFAPVAIQERVKGTSLRLFVIGSEVLGCEIQTDALDFREDLHAELTPIKVTSALEELALKATRALHLIWSGVDVIRREDGQFVFLEANPSPMFIGFEKGTGLPLTKKLCALLST